MDPIIAEQLRDLIRNRVSVEDFDPDRPLSEDEVRAMVRDAIQAPSSFNIQHWRFVVVRDPELRRKIRTEHGNDQAQMTDASLLVIVTGDVKAAEDCLLRMAQMMTDHPEVQEFDINPLILYARGEGAAVADGRMAIGRG